MQKIHFVAIGGAVMHNLAIALKKKGFEVTGSDDEIFEPSKSRLLKYNLLPKYTGWNPDAITSEIDSIILGMHAREDNPEIIKAKQLGIKMFSFPEYMYELTKEKTRVVVAGSHGKTSITSMIMHTLKNLNMQFDYLVGSQIEGFETMVDFSEDTKFAVFEGDEYLSSVLDKRPKFHIYKPQVALLSGISWDHMNVFPTFDIYYEQFKIFVNQIPSNGALIYNAEDEIVKKLAEEASGKFEKIPYYTHPYRIKDGQTYLIDNNKEFPVPIFGKHNMQNLNGALEICMRMGVSRNDFYSQISSFTGAARRLQRIIETENTSAWLDFAHSPSKVKATCNAVKELYPNKKLLAIYELHTFSSLNRDFLPEYKNSLDKADNAIVFVDYRTLTHKKLPELSNDFLQDCFSHANSTIAHNIDEIYDNIKTAARDNANILLMSSGNFSGLDLSRVKQMISENEE